MRQFCRKYYEAPIECQSVTPKCDECIIKSDNIPNYNYLNEKYVSESNKVHVINGLLMAQTICARSLIEHHSTDILKLMGTISEVIENIKNGDQNERD